MEFGENSLKRWQTSLANLQLMSMIDLSATASSRKPPMRARVSGALGGAVILLGTERRENADVVKAQLRRDGASAVLCRRSVEDVTAALTLGGIDLVQIDRELPGGDAIALARGIRFGEVGKNPFVPVILTTWRLEIEAINAALEAGADDIVGHPLSAAMISRRASRLAASRKLFVAGNSYIGPERPSMPEALANAPRFEAPNTLKALAEGDAVSLAANLQAIESARQRLFGFRIGAAAESIGLGARALLSDGAAGVGSAALGEGVEALAALASVLPTGGLKDAAIRLAALGKVAAKSGDEASRAAKLTVEIADAICLILGADDADELVLPPDIIQRIDKRFPRLVLSIKPWPGGPIP